MTEQAVVQRRRGGREARRELRAQPIAAEARAVRPGLSGGRYRALGDAEVQAIHRAALDVLEEIGLADAIPSCLELMTAAGAIRGERSAGCACRARWSRTWSRAPRRRFVLHAADPAHDLEPWDKKVFFGTAGAAVHIVEPDGRDYRESTLADLYDLARLVDRLDHVHFFQRPVVTRDLPDPRELDLNTAYACIAGTAQARRHELRPARACRRGGGDAASRRRRRGRVAGAAVRLDVLLLRRAAAQVRRRRLPLPRGRRARRHAGAAARRGPGRRHEPGGARRRGRAGGRRGAGGPRLRQPAEPRPPGDLRALAVRLRPAHGRDERRQRRAGAAHRGLRPDGPVLRPADRHARPA